MSADAARTSAYATIDSPLPNGIGDWLLFGSRVRGRPGDILGLAADSIQSRNEPVSGAAGSPARNAPRFFTRLAMVLHTPSDRRSRLLFLCSATAQAGSAGQS